MREIVEFRIPEDRARRFLDPNEGERLGDSVRKLQVAVEDPLFARVGRLDRQIRAEEGRFFFHGWSMRRQYSRQEIKQGELFRLKITSVFEPTGDECGTLYDETTACPLCKSGRTQVSDLVLDLRKAPKTKQIARTLADDEWIVSQQLAELLVDSGMTGFELRPVRHKARHQDDPIYLDRYPSGRYLLQRAEAAGAQRPTWGFYVWLNRPENRELWDLAKEEQAAEGARREERRAYRPTPPWYQLVVTSKPVPLVPPTRAGIEPFDEDPDDTYRCPLGHTLGLNLLSEVWVHRDTWDGSDFARTEQMVGHRQGVLVPAPILLISPRMRGLLEEHKIKGYSVEVAHLVP